MKKESLLRSTLILSFGAVLAKVFSAVYRIMLTRVLGGSGIGIYQLVLPIYSLFVIIVSTGLPMGISKVVSRNKGNEKNVFKKCSVIVLSLSIAVSLILFLFSDLIAKSQGNANLRVCYFILSPSIIVIAVSSLIKGYFQGVSRFSPTALSNIFEQFFKLVLGLGLSLLLVKFGALYGVIGAVIGISLSEIISLLILLLYFRKEKLTKGKVKVSYLEIYRDVVPITITNLILPLSSFIDSILVVNLLKFNFSSDVSVFLYGLETGAVSTLVTLPTIFSFAIASVILPNVTTIKNQFNRDSKFTFAIKVVLILSVPCFLCFLCVPDRLLNFLYSNKINSCGIDGLKIATKLLAISSLSVVFATINQIFSSSLQAVDKRGSTIKNLSIGAICKLIFELLFLPSLILNIYTLSIANLIMYSVSAVLNYLEIRNHYNLKLNTTFLSKLLLCNICMLVALISVFAVNNSPFNTILGGLIAVLTYVFSLFVFNIFSKKDKATLKYRL